MISFRALEDGYRILHHYDRREMSIASILKRTIRDRNPDFTTRGKEVPHCKPFYEEDRRQGQEFIKF